MSRIGHWKQSFNDHEGSKHRHGRNRHVGADTIRGRQGRAQHRPPAPPQTRQRGHGLLPPRREHLGQRGKTREKFSNFGPPHSSSTRTSLTPEDSFDHSKSETFACFSISTKRINLFVVKLRFKLEIYSIVGNVEKCTLEHRVSTTTKAATTGMVETDTSAQADAF